MLQSQSFVSRLRGRPCSQKLGSSASIARLLSAQPAGGSSPFSPENPKNRALLTRHYDGSPDRCCPLPAGWPPCCCEDAFPLNLGFRKFGRGRVRQIWLERSGCPPGGWGGPRPLVAAILARAPLRHAGLVALWPRVGSSNRMNSKACVRCGA